MNKAAAIPSAVVESASQLAINEGEMLVGFKPITETDPLDSGRWVAKLWMVITNKGYYEFTPDGTCVRAAVLHPIRSNQPVYVVDTSHWPDIEDNEYVKVMEVAVDLILHSGHGPEDKDRTGSTYGDLMQSQLMDVMFRDPRMYETFESIARLQTRAVVATNEMRRRENDLEDEVDDESTTYTGPKNRFFMGYSLAMQDDGQWAVLRGALLKTLPNLQLAEAWAVAHSEGKVNADV